MRYALAVLFSLFLFTPAAFAQIPDVNDGHLLSARWTATATNPNPPGPAGPQLGDSITLTWGFVGDGTLVAADGTNEGSSLISFLDNNFNDNSSSTDLTQRSWFPVFSETFARYDALSGLNFVYEPNDNDATLNGGGAGSLGNVADVRIGGRSIDGQAGANTLAFAFFPNSGDIVIDTDNSSFFGSDTVGFRNVIAHEFGHSLGIAHLESTNERFLLEPIIDTSFDGPQHSDILAVHRGYGDQFEGGAGNDSATNATSIGNIDVFAGIGLDGDNVDVAITDEDFVSIDGSNDSDFFSFNVTQAGQLTINVTPEGYSYDVREEDAPLSDSVTVNTSALSDLEFVLFDQDGVTQLASANANGVGLAESIAGFNLSAGTYFIEVSSADDQAQFYSVTSSFISAVPEPSSAMLLALGFVVPVLRRKRA